MNPIGAYQTFYDELIRRYNDYGDHEIISFGILLADFRQQDAREYILNYLEDFDRESGKYFDFFIPGYIEEWSIKWCKSNAGILQGRDIKVRNTGYVFNYELFSDFYQNLDHQFGIKYTYNPMLILMSMERNYPGSARYIVIELDNIGKGIRRSGVLFERIFEIAKGDNSMEAFRKRCFYTFVQDDIVSTISSAIGIPWLEQIAKIGTECKRYRIRG